MKRYRILIVEDENIPANYVKKILEQYGHNVIGIADTQAKALAYLHTKQPPELILMDIKLKDGDDGIETAKAFLKEAQVAVIYLSAYGDEDFLKRAQETRPIGYLVKPVQPQSLLSTIAVGMANYAKERLNTSILLTGSLKFDPNAQVLIDGENEVALSKYESRLLETLIKSPNRLISYATLENSAWREEPPKDGALRTTIWRLRKKLPESVAIENLYSSGYKINL